MRGILAAHLSLRALLIIVKRIYRDARECYYYYYYYEKQT